VITKYDVIVDMQSWTLYVEATISTSDLLCLSKLSYIEDDLVLDLASIGMWWRWQ
jgi:hypothetical protein